MICSNVLGTAGFESERGFRASYRRSEWAVMRIRAVIALTLFLAPGLAFANPKGTVTRMRPQLFRDRAPKAHVRQSQPHHSNVPVAH